MALPIRKPDSSKPDPISQGVGNYLSGQNNQAENALKKAVSASEIRGSGLTKVTDLIAQIGRQMVDQVAANTNLEMETKEMLDEEVANAVAATVAEKEAEELLSDELRTDDAANDNVEMPDNQINPVDAINSFGTDPTNAANDNVEIPDDIEANQTEEPVPNEGTAPARSEPGSTESPRSAESAPKKDRAQKGSEQQPSETSANQPTETPAEGAENPVEDAKNPEETPEGEQGQTEPGTPTEPTSESKKNEPDAESNKPNTPDDKKEEENKPKEDAPEKPKEETPPEEKPPEPETNLMTANQDEKDSGLGEPLVKTDDAGHPIPRGQEQKNGQTNSNTAGQNENPQQGQPQNQTTTETNQGGTNPASGGQNPQQRGILLQKFNERRNKQLITEIDKKAQQLNQDKIKLQKEIKTIDEFLKPLEREHTALTFASWTLLAIEILIKVLAAILAATIIFLFIVPIAPMVWTASNIPAVLKTGIDIKIKDLEKKMEAKKKERDEKRKKLKSVSDEIRKLATQRFRIINQSLLTTLKQQ